MLCVDIFNLLLIASNPGVSVVFQAQNIVDFLVAGCGTGMVGLAV